MRLLLFLLLITASAAQAAPSIGILWKAKALEAAEKLSNQDSSEANEQSGPQRLEAMLDFAYAMHFVQPEVVHKPWVGGGDAFHILMTARAGGLLDIVYLYESNGSPGGVRLDALPKGWMIIFHPDKVQGNTASLIEMRREKLGINDLPAPQPLVIKADDGMLVFDLVDPFNAFVLERALNIPSIPSLVEKMPVQTGKGRDQSSQQRAKEKVKPPVAGGVRTKDGQ